MRTITIMVNRPRKWTFSAFLVKGVLCQNRRNFRHYKLVVFWGMFGMCWRVRLWCREWEFIRTSYVRRCNQWFSDPNGYFFAVRLTTVLRTGRRIPKLMPHGNFGGSGVHPLKKKWKNLLSAERKLTTTANVNLADYGKAGVRKISTITYSQHWVVQKTVLAWDIFRFPSGPHKGQYGLRQTS